MYPKITFEMEKYNWLPIFLHTLVIENLKSYTCSSLYRLWKCPSKKEKWLTIWGVSAWSSYPSTQSSKWCYASGRKWWEGEGVVEARKGPLSGCWGAGILVIVGRRRVSREVTVSHGEVKGGSDWGKLCEVKMYLSSRVARRQKRHISKHCCRVTGRGGAG